MIREITASDHNLYIQLCKEFYSSDAVDHPVLEKNFENGFAELMRSKEYMECFIFEEASQVSGYGLISKTFSNEGGGMVVWIEEVFIKENFRGLGIGKSFLTFIEDKFKNTATRIRLEITPSNTSAHKLYSRIGYNDLGYLQMLKEL